MVQTFASLDVQCSLTAECALIFTPTRNILFSNKQRSRACIILRFAEAGEPSRDTSHAMYMALVSHRLITRRRSKTESFSGGFLDGTDFIRRRSRDARKILAAENRLFISSPPFRPVHRDQSSRLYWRDESFLR